VLSIHRIAAAVLVAAALCVPATASADDWYKTGAQGQTTQDLVTPDARDAARPLVRVVVPSRTRIVEVPRAGFEWGDAAIGGAAILAFVRPDRPKRSGDGIEPSNRRATTASRFLKAPVPRCDQGFDGSPGAGGRPFATNPSRWKSRASAWPV
jgi:hypothetical protein